MPSRYDRLHPLTKLSIAVVLIVAAYLSPTIWTSIVICGAALLTTAASSRRGTIARVYPLFFVPITFSLLLIRGVLVPDVRTSPIDVGGVVLSMDAIAGAWMYILRYCTLVAALFTVIQTTPTALLMHALAERGLPRSIEFILLMALQIIPDMKLRADAILEAQQSRGLVMHSLPSRIKALVPLIGPLVVGALVDVEERSMALELRAFAATNRPTRMTVLIDSHAQRVFRVACIGAVVVMGVAVVLVRYLP